MTTSTAIEAATVKRPRAIVRRFWESLSERARRHALVYCCNLQLQIHHNCEHAGRDLAYYQRNN